MVLRINPRANRRFNQEFSTKNREGIQFNIGRRLDPILKRIKKVRRILQRGLGEFCPRSCSGCCCGGIRTKWCECPPLLEINKLFEFGL
jgi:hypothetical protein